jgi:[acyl-carrier-protein] S-malonyltransferase
MSKIAFMFPGQGSQAAGMGRSLFDEFPEARAIFEEADDALSFGLSQLCFQGPDDQLRLTENTQPAILTVSTAAAAVLKARGFRPDYVVGHSLGEYSALVAAGAIAFADAVRLVRLRGRYMQEAVPPGVGAMAALLKMPLADLDRVLAEAAQGEVVSAANFNSPDQLVIAGHAGAVQRAMDLAKAAGAKRAVPLPVSAPFHCDLMRPAQERMRAEIDAVAFRDLEIPLINNWQGKEIRLAAEAKQGLVEQIPNPVRWTDSILYLAAQQVSSFVEVGPGAVLNGLLRSITAEAKGSRFGEASDLPNLNLAQ